MLSYHTTVLEELYIIDTKLSPTETSYLVKSLMSDNPLVAEAVVKIVLSLQWAMAMGVYVWVQMTAVTWYSLMPYVSYFHWIVCQLVIIYVFLFPYSANENNHHPLVETEGKY